VQARFRLLTTRDAVLPHLVTCLMTVRTSLPLGVRVGRLRRHWPKTRIVWRGDSHYGRVEAMEWADQPRRHCRARRSGGGDRFNLRFIMDEAARRSCAPMRASCIRPGVGVGRARTAHVE
jgi:hypothetical protein